MTIMVTTIITMAENAVAKKDAVVKKKNAANLKNVANKFHLNVVMSQYVANHVANQNHAVNHVVNHVANQSHASNILSSNVKRNANVDAEDIKIFLVEVL
jgi:hypothetical protein